MDQFISCKSLLSVEESEMSCNHLKLNQKEERIIKESSLEVWSLSALHMKLQSTVESEPFFLKNMPFKNLKTKIGLLL